MTSDSLDRETQRARLLQTIEQTVRRDTGFQANWKVSRGTNVWSPIYELFHQSDKRPVSDAAMMQTISILPPHPKESAKTISRVVLSFYEGAIRSGQSGSVYSDFHGYRARKHKAVQSVISIHLPAKLAAQIRKTVEASPSKDPFLATVVFELMDHGDHEIPYFGVPAIGPYKNFNEVNRFGIRLEWRHYETGQWFSSRRHQLVARSLFEGDPTRLLALYQEGMAMIHMIRGQEFPDAPDGFWTSLAFRGSRPAHQRLEVSHRFRTVRWVPVTPTKASPLQRSTCAETRSWLVDNMKKLSPSMGLGTMPPEGDGFWWMDLRSTKASRQHCDTCTILHVRRFSQDRRPPREYDADTKSCQVCGAMNRVCTFTPFKALMAGWVGKPEAELNYDDYLVPRGVIHFPVYGAGPMRQLVSHISIGDSDSP